MSFGKHLTLNTGAKIPQIGFGTWQAPPGEVGAAVEVAVKAGYRHLDFAHVYENQKEIGEVLKKLIPAVVKREDLFITSKLWNSSHVPSRVPIELDITLSDLGLDYLDLYLIHWPAAFKSGDNLYPRTAHDETEVELDTETPLVDTWKAMLKLRETGKVRAVGVSNFSDYMIDEIIAATGVVPAANQIEAHPLLPQDDLVKYCNEKNIHITAYSPLGNNTLGIPLLIQNQVVKDVASKLGATPAQVLVAWGAKRGYSVIPKSVHADRVESNFKQVELSDEDYKSVSSVMGSKYTRYNIPYRYKPWWNISIFGEPEEAKAVAKPRVK